MIQTIEILPQTLTSTTDDINFTTTDLRTNSASCCGWLQYNEGSSNFTIIGDGRTPATFEIHFNANVTSETAGQVAIALKTNGSDVEGTEMNADIATAGNYTNISFTKLVRLCPRINQTFSVGSLAAVGGVTPAAETEIPILKDINFYIKKI